MTHITHSEAIDSVLAQKEFNFVKWISWENETLKIKTIYNENVYTLEEFTRCFIISLGINVVFVLETLEDKLIELDNLCRR